VVLVEFADNVRFRVSRSSITEVLAKTEPVSTAKAKDDSETKEDGQAAPVADAPKTEEKSSSILGKLLGRK
jgi:hypothetical protein